MSTQERTLAFGRIARFAAVGLAATLAFGSGGGLAMAQSSPARAAEGITVIGYGKASAPAETAILQIVLTNEDYGRPRAIRPGGTPGAQEREEAETVTDELRAVGVADDAIEVIVNPIGGEFFGPDSGQTRIDVSVEEPTPERITELINAAILGASLENLFVGQVGVGYNVADCAPVERDAREEALSDAQERAEIQADLLGVELGDVRASADQPLDPILSIYYGPFSPSGTGCAPASPSESGAPISVPPYDPTAPAEVNVYAEIAVTYALGEATGS